MSVPKLVRLAAVAAAVVGVVAPASAHADPPPAAAHGQATAAQGQSEHQPFGGGTGRKVG